MEVLAVLAVAVMGMQVVLVVQEFQGKVMPVVMVLAVGIKRLVVAEEQGLLA
jgi:hypothetical protein